MKTIILTTLTTIFSLTLCFSQDVITKKSGEDIQSKILEVGQTEIKYKKFDNQNGPTFTILKSEVLMVRYENGTKDIFNEEKKSENVSSLSLSSGTDKAQSYFSTSFYNDQGWTIADKVKRYTINTRNTYNFSNKFSAGFKVAGSVRQQQPV